MIKERLKKERRRGDTVPLCFVCKETSISIYNFYANVDSLCIPPAYLESNSTEYRSTVWIPRNKGRKKERKQRETTSETVDGNWTNSICVTPSSLLESFIFLSRIQKEGWRYTNALHGRKSPRNMNMKEGRASYNHSHDRWIVVSRSCGVKPR